MGLETSSDLTGPSLFMLPLICPVENSVTGKAVDDPLFFSRM